MRIIHTLKKEIDNPYKILLLLIILVKDVNYYY